VRLNKILKKWTTKNYSTNRKSRLTRVMLILTVQVADHVSASMQDMPTAATILHHLTTMMRADFSLRDSVQAC
jgi:hypothetical protein